MRVVSFKGFAHVDTNTAWAAPIKRFADQLRESAGSRPVARRCRGQWMNCDSARPVKRNSRRHHSLIHLTPIWSDG